MDEHSQQQPQKTTSPTDGEIIANVQKKLHKINSYLEEKRITFTWKIIFAVIILANLIPLGYFLIILSTILVPSPMGIYFLLLAGYMWHIPIGILLATILTILLFISIQRPQGRTLDFFIRLIYISVIAYIVPLVIFLMNFFNL